MFLVYDPEIKECLPLVSGHDFVRMLPSDLENHNKHFFEGLPEIRITDSTYQVIGDVTALGNGYLFQGTKLLKNSFVPGRYPSRWKQIEIVGTRIFIGSRPKSIDEGMWITDGWSGNYYHWMTDALPRLLALSKLTKLPPLLLPEKFAQISFIWESLKALDIDEIIIVPRDGAIRTRRLLYPNYICQSHEHHPDIAAELRDRLRSRFGDSETAGRRVYISRSKARKRRITNEDETESLLLRMGFEIARAEQLTFQQQVSLFSQSSIIFGPHGAGLTNTMFMMPGGALIEIHPYDDNINPCFFTLATAMRQRYYFMMSTEKGPNIASHRDDIVVDLDNLERIINIATSS